MTKNVAGTCSRRRIAAIFGVQRGSGPSSNVSAIRRPGGGWVETRREPFAARIGRLWTSGAGPPSASCGSALAPTVWVAIPSKRIATAATTKQKLSKRQCAGTRNRARAFTLRLLRRRDCRRLSSSVRALGSYGRRGSFFSPRGVSCSAHATHRRTGSSSSVRALSRSAHVDELGLHLPGRRGVSRPRLLTSPTQPVAANTLAGTAGRRSAADGCRGRGSFASGGGPCEGRRTCTSGIPVTGIKPRPPSTIANSQPRNSKNTRRPARRSHRARLPVGSSRTEDPPPPTVVPGIPMQTDAPSSKHSKNVF